MTADRYFSLKEIFQFCLKLKVLNTFKNVLLWVALHGQHRSIPVNTVCRLNGVLLLG